MSNSKTEEIEIPDSTPVDAVIMVNNYPNPDEDNPDGRIQIVKRYETCPEKIVPIT